MILLGPGMAATVFLLGSVIFRHPLLKSQLHIALAYYLLFSFS